MIAMVTKNLTPKVISAFLFLSLSTSAIGIASLCNLPHYTVIMFSSWSCHLEKYSDHSAVVGGISDGKQEKCRALMDDFAEWSGRNHLLLKLNKSREMVINLRQKRLTTQRVSSSEQDAVLVAEYECLDVHMNKRQIITDTV